MSTSKTFQQLCDEAKSRIQEVSTEGTEELLKTHDSVILIDVREQDEFRGGHIPGALGVGRGILEYHIADLAPDTDQEIILYCRGGNRSALAADSLRQMGYTNVLSMTGGYRTWNEEGRAETTSGEPIVH
ncbi:MAG: sulfurtransferase [Cytophagales bacterium]|nr:sulfurtransferase [Armatimonadota bacterium]